MFISSSEAMLGLAMCFQNGTPRNAEPPDFAKRAESRAIKLLLGDVAVRRDLEGGRGDITRGCRREYG